MSRRLVLLVAVSAFALVLTPLSAPAEAAMNYQAIGGGPATTPCGFVTPCTFTVWTSLCSMSSAGVGVVGPTGAPCFIELSGTVNLTISGLVCSGIGPGTVRLYDGAWNQMSSAIALIQIVGGTLTWEGFDQLIDGRDSYTTGRIAMACNSPLGQMTAEYTATFH